MHGRYGTGGDMRGGGARRSPCAQGALIFFPRCLRAANKDLVASPVAVDETRAPRRPISGIRLYRGRLPFLTPPTQSSNGVLHQRL